MRITTPNIQARPRDPLSVSLPAGRRSGSQDLPAQKGSCANNEPRRSRGVVDAEWFEIYDAGALPLKEDRNTANLSMVQADKKERLNPFEILPPGDPAIERYNDSADQAPPPPGSIINIYA